MTKKKTTSKIDSTQLTIPPEKSDTPLNESIEAGKSKKKTARKKNTIELSGPIRGTGEQVQALAWWQSLPRAEFKWGGFEIVLFPNCENVEIINVFTVARVECGGDDYAFAKSKIINSSLGDIMAIPEWFLEKDQVLEDKKFISLAEWDISADLIPKARLDDKINGVIAMILLTYAEFEKITATWKIRDNAIPPIITFLRSVLPGTKVSENTRIAFEKKLNWMREWYGYDNVAPLKPREELLSSLLGEITNAITKVGSDPESSPVGRFVQRAVMTEYDSKKSTNEWFLKELFLEIIEKDDKKELEDLRKITLNLHRDGWIMVFPKDSEGPKILNKVLIFRIIYGLIYGLSWIRGDFKSVLFEMGQREDISTYFQRNGNGMSFNYIESDGEGNGKFGPHIHLVRKTDWDISHDSENLHFSTKDVLFQKAAAMSEVERSKSEISTLKQENSTLKEKIQTFERIEMEREKEETRKSEKIRRYLEAEAVMSETRKELLEFLISQAGDAASKKTKSRTVKNYAVLPQ